MTKTKRQNLKSKRVRAPRTRWNLRLYIAGDTSRSITALTNLQRICDEAPSRPVPRGSGRPAQESATGGGRPDRSRAHPGAPSATAAEKDYRGPVELAAGARFASGKGVAMTAQSLKRALATATTSANHNKKYVLRLYVTGATSSSRRAILNINSICTEHLRGK